MDQAGIIRDLLSWLESHLDQPLSLDNVAAKAGYPNGICNGCSKILPVTPSVLTSARRLSKAAVALRLTGRPILDIALQYRFDSQQTFTRAFKNSLRKRRRCTAAPKTGTRSASVRRSVWGPSPCRSRNSFLLPDKHLVGLTQSYSCTLEQITTVRTELRSQFWRQFLGDVDTLPPVLYGLHHSRPSRRRTTNRKCCTPRRWSRIRCLTKYRKASRWCCRAGNLRCSATKGPPRGCKTSS